MAISEDDADLTDKPKREKKEKPAAGTPSLRIKGRVLARATVDERQDYSRELDIASARLEADAELGRFGAELSADVAKKSMLRDAFITYRGDAFRAWAGRFKAPFLQRQLTSQWDLPIVGRGLVEDYLVDVHDLGGRRFGALAQLRQKEWKRFEASVGVFQGGKDELGTRLTEDLSGRLGVRPFKMLELGASGYATEVFVGRDAVLPKRAGAVDAELKFGRWALSAEATAGSLPIGSFLAQLALLQVDLPLNVGTWTLRPAIGAESMQLKGDTVAGQGHALTAAVGVHDEAQFQMQLQGERALKPGDVRVAHTLAIQAGFRF